MLVDFNLTLLNLAQNSLPETHLQIHTAPRIEVAICFFYGAPLFRMVEFTESKV